MNSTRLPAFKRGRAFAIEVDGHQITAYEGETVATVLLAAGMNTFHSPVQTVYPSSRLFCGMGVCMQCLVTINGRPSHRACRTMAQPGKRGGWDDR